MACVTIAFLLAVITFGLVLSCTQNNRQGEVSSKSLREDCQVIQHGMGETCISQNPQRLIALNPAALGNAISLGLKPVGSVIEYDGQFATYLKNKTEGIQPIGDWGQPSMERIALLKPAE